MSNRLETIPLQDELVSAVVTPQFDFSYERILQSPVMQYDTQKETNQERRLRKHNRSRHANQVRVPEVESYLDYQKEAPRHHHRHSSRRSSRNRDDGLSMEHELRSPVPILGERYILGAKRVEEHGSRRHSSKHAHKKSPHSEEVVPIQQNNSKIPSVDQLVSKLMEVTDNWSGTLDELSQAHKELEAVKTSLKEKQTELEKAQDAVKLEKEKVRKSHEKVSSLEEEVGTLQRQIGELHDDRKSELNQHASTEKAMQEKMELAKDANQDMEEQITKLMLDKVRLQQELHQERTLRTPVGEQGDRIRKLEEENDALRMSLKALVSNK